MKLVPVGKERLWGGRRLKKEFGKTFDIDCLGESWDISELNLVVVFLF